MAIDTINVQFRREIGVISDDIEDVFLEDTLIPRGLALVNALCRQSYTISDFTQATIGSSEDDYELVDTIIALFACSEAWRTEKRRTTVRVTTEFPEYKTYLYDAWNIVAQVFPGVMERQGGQYFPSQEKMHSAAKPFGKVIVGDGIAEAGQRAVTTSHDITENDR